MTLEISSSVGIEENLKQFLIVLLVSLSVATLSQSWDWFRKIPYTLLLVIVGLGLAFVDIRLVNLSPQLILLIFLPPLVFEAAWNIEWSHIKRDLVPISLYAVFGVVISIAGVAFALNQLAGIALGTALLVGASISATDPVSVIALFRELGVGKRLSTLMEGESLFNDGIAVVAFVFLLGVNFGGDDFSFPSLVARFFAFVGIAVGVGSLIGFGISFLTQRFDLPLVEQSSTLVAAYGAYLIAEDLGGSGVIAVVVAGLILGNFGSRIGMNPRTRLIVTEFWNFLAFFVNSIVFLLIGDQIRFATLLDNLFPIAVLIAAVILTRLIAIFGLGALSNWVAKSEIPLTDQTVLWWGGLRGSVSIALALSLPVDLPEKEKMIALIFGVVLFTLLVQGLTTKALLDKFGMLKNQAVRQEYREAIARRAALNRAINKLSGSHSGEIIEPEYYLHLVTTLKQEISLIQEEINKLHAEDPDLEKFAINDLHQELEAIEADTYAELIRVGKLSEFPPLLLHQVLKKEQSSISAATNH